MPISDIDFLLEDAKRSTKFIEQSYIESLNEKEVSIVLRLKIKHFLENNKSALDYLAYEVFKKYSLDNIKSKQEDHLRGLYFPSKPNKDKFDKYIENMYPGLNHTKPEIVDLFESIQPYKGDNWFTHLNDMVNKSKHRELTPQKRIEQKRVKIINNGNGEILSDFTHGSVSILNSTGISISGMNWDQVNQLPIPNENRDLEISNWIGFIFSNSKLHVIPTLNEIYDGNIRIVSKIKELL